jgi:hypothetical protein
MNKIVKQDVGFEKVEELVDATGNMVKAKRSKKKLSAKEKKKMMALIRRKIADTEDLDSEEEDYAIEWDL